VKHPSSLVSVWNLLITLRLTLGSHTSRLYGWFQPHFRSRTLQSGLIWASTTSFHKGTSRCFGQPMSLRNGFVNTAARRQFCSCSGRCHTMSSESFVFSSSVLDNMYRKKQQSHQDTLKLKSMLAPAPRFLSPSPLHHTTKMNTRRQGFCRVTSIYNNRRHPRNQHG